MRRPHGSDADEWHLFLSEYLDNRANSPSGLTFIAVQIAEALDEAQESRKLDFDALQQTLFDLGNGTAVNFSPRGRFHGWLFRRHPDGQWISVHKLEKAENHFNKDALK